MKKNNKVIIIGVMIIAIILISIVGTYAYFLATVGETVNEKLIVKAGTLQLVFRDTDEIVTNTEATLNFGDTITKEFEIENTGTLTTYAKISWDNLINTYLEESLTYKLEYKLKDTEEEWKKAKTVQKNVPRNEVASKISLADHLKITAEETYVFKLTITLEDLEDIDQTQDLEATLSTKFTLDESLSESEQTLKNLNLKVQKPKEGVPDFSKTATTDETKDGLFSMEDDYGTSYYFRGAVENNYVKFGQNKDGQDMWWRIIRINGDGSLRIVYDGTQGWANGTANDSRVVLAKQRWNIYYNDMKYSGWMFGGAQGEASTSYEEATRNETNSDIKTAVDNWYVENIKNTGYSKYLSDEVFCNDRTAYTDEAGTITGNGYGIIDTYYGGYVRLNTNKTPKLKCPQKNDMFTLKDEVSKEVARGVVEGNKALDYPIGLITADEISAAGGVYGKNNINYYLYKTSNYISWSFSPARRNGSSADMFIVHNNNSSFGEECVDFAGSTASPVINIAPDYVVNMQGAGTIEDPYELNI